MRTLIACFITIFFSFQLSFVQGQCANIEDVIISDNTTQEIFFTVDGLIDDDLSAGTNNICRVDLSFAHDYIGDLIITLTSPSGDMVTLIGSPTTAIGPTNNSSWEISMISCDSTAMPDLGFLDVFENNQTWGILAPYTGDYYPNNGCFSDFNTGSANGVWTITIDDVDAPASGLLTSVSIHFCDDTGLACFDCEADAGFFADTDVAICGGSELDQALLIPSYSGSQPDASDYAYEYIMHRNDTIYSFGQIVDISTLVAGEYEICGLSYFAGQFPLVNGILDTALFSELQQHILNADFCGDLTDNCIQLSVVEPPLVVQIDITVCKGDTARYLGNPYTPGTHMVTVVDGLICDSLVRLRVLTNATQANIQVPDSIVCNSSGVQLNGALSNIPGNPTYQWSTELGTITSNTQRDTIRVISPGEYTLIVSDGICFDTSTVSVIGDETYPQVFTNGGILNCDSLSINLRADAFPLDVQYGWRLNGGAIFDNQQSIQVSIPGLYTIEVTNDAGCINFAEAMVSIDTIEPIIVIIQNPKDCQNQNIRIRTAGAGLGSNYFWTTPSNNVIRSRFLTATETGYHYINVIGANGCQNSDSVFVDGDYTIPDIDAIVYDSIYCGILGAQLDAVSASLIVNYSWTGPMGFISDIQDPSAISPGTHFVEVLATNGCQNVDSIEVSLSTEIFNYDIITDTITCNKDSAIIQINSGIDLLFNWLDFSNIPLTQSNIVVFNPGIYSTILLDTLSGCTQLVNIEVPVNINLPNWNWVRDTITCLDPIAEVSFNTIGPSNPASFFWTLPDGSTETNNTLSIAESGMVRLTVVGENGCSRFRNLEVTSNIISPLVFSSAEDLGCFDSIPVSVLAIDSVETYQWSGPNSFSSLVAEPFVQDTGVYQLLVTDLNGCTNLIVLQIEADTSKPGVVIGSEELTCLDTVVSLVMTPIDSVLSYEWSFQNTVIGNDSLIEVQSVGLYIAQSIGLNNCTSLDTVEVFEPLEPDVSMIGDTITCSNLEVPFVASSSVVGATFEWTNSLMNVVSSTNELLVSDNDLYTLTVTSINGCTHDTSIIAAFDTISPIPIITQLSEILCMNRDVELSALQSLAIDDVSYLWVAAPGTILSGMSDSIVLVRDTGTYFLTLTHLGNGCAQSTQFEILESPNSITDAYLSIIPPACVDEANAEIQLDSIIGGSGDVSISVNGEMNMDSIVSMLLAGTYEISIIDAVGCTFDTTLVIIETEEVSVDLGPDREIFIGDTIHISANIDFDISRVISVNWINEFGLDTTCLVCLNFVFQPLVTTTYQVAVENDLGCIVESEVTIFVIEKGNFFVPNIFTPNNDGLNDEITFLATNSVERVLEFGIFNRFGNQVYGAKDFIPGDAQVFWDGELDNVPLNPGVFTWFAIYRVLSPNGGVGRIEKKSGDITLLR